MKLRSRFTLAIAVASLVPLGLLGAGAAGVAIKEVLDKETELLQSTGDGRVLFIEQWLYAQRHQLEQWTGLFPFDVEASSDESHPADEQAYQDSYLKTIYRLVPSARIVSVYKVEPGGQGLDIGFRHQATFPGEEQSGSDSSTGTDPTREPISTERAKSFESQLPMDALIESWQALNSGNERLPPVFGRPYLPEGRNTPVMPTATLLRENGATYVLGIELALDDLAQQLNDVSDNAPALAVLDHHGEFIFGGNEALVDLSAFRPLLGNRSTVRYTSERNDQEVLAVTQGIPNTGWTIVVAAPVDVSAVAARKIRNATAYLAAVAGILCLLVGFVLSKQLAVPVVQLKNAALDVAGGTLGRTIEPKGADEITELTQSFNYMSAKLKEDAEQIDHQRLEIEAFNLELQQRVEQRTAELEEAHQQLLRSSRLAAVGEMGAGLAHELNNPIAGILGMTQLLMAKSQPEKMGMLKAVEEQALRCKDIVSTLLVFSNDLSSGETGESQNDHEHVDLTRLMTQVLNLVESALSQRGVSLDASLDQHLHIRGNSNELGGAFAQLFTSICAEAPEGGRLQVRGKVESDNIEMEISLEGPIIRKGSDDWKASGLGFWAARRVLAGHDGYLERDDHTGLETKEASVARWRIRFPQA